MAKKKKTSLSVISRRGKEKLRAAISRFDQSCLLLLILIIIASAIACSGEYDLSTPSATGFAYWFLQLGSYLPLLLASLCSIICGVEINFAASEWLLLGISDITLLFAIWLAVRFYAGRKGLKLVRNTRIFIMIYIYWGIFQLLCCAGVTLWEHGSFSQLHDHIRIEQENR